MPETPPQAQRSGRGSEAVSHNDAATIRVRVVPAFMPGESQPAGQGQPPLYLFMYEVTITNDAESPMGVQLLTRHWIIVDADGERRDVRGEGVVGRQPHLAPGESFTYASSCPLPTRWGTMEGSYHLVADDGATFDAAIDRFYLVAEPTRHPVGDGL